MYIHFLVVILSQIIFSCRGYRAPWVRLPHRQFSWDALARSSHGLTASNGNEGRSPALKQLAQLLLNLPRIGLPRQTRAHASGRHPDTISSDASPPALSTSGDVDTIIFDIDDTLYSTSSGFSEHRMVNVTMQFAVEKLGFKSEQDAFNLWSEYIKRYHSSLKGFAMADQEGRLPRPFRQEDLGSYWAEKCDFARFLTRDPSLIASLEALSSSGLKLVAFSNAPRAYAIRVLQIIGVSHLFTEDRIFGVEDVMPACKPEAEAFQKVLDSVGSQAHRTVMVEDSMKNVRAARQMGMHTVLVQESPEHVNGEADLLDDSPDPEDPAVGIVLRRASSLLGTLPDLSRGYFKGRYKHKDSDEADDSAKIVQPFDYKALVSAVSEDKPLIVVGLDGKPCNLSVASKARKIGVLDSSFNPPTLAHSELLKLADDAIVFDMKLLMLGKSNADKAMVGAALDQRLAMMHQMAASHPQNASPAKLSVTCHALFVDKARSLLGMLSEDGTFSGSTVYFIVGSDTIVRIFDPKYYSDPENELDELFSMAHLISIDRDEASSQTLRKTLDAPLAQKFKNRITLLTFDDQAMQEISSTRVRKAVEAGDSLNGLLLPSVENYVQKHTEMYSANSPETVEVKQS